MKCAEHPRSRGENEIATTGRLNKSGTSPLTRGKQIRGRPERGHGRNIPAHAGKTVNPIYSDVLLSGTSPLTRGKRRRTRCANPACRNIPAHAGKTFFVGGREVARWEHPRSRGENHSIRTGIPIARGTSPLTRGKPATPAPTDWRTSEHPRSRGENTY